MSLREKFKKSVESVLRQYERSYSDDNDTISSYDSLAITHIRELLKSDDYLDDMREKIYSYVNSLEGSFFSFLPFVHDLKKIVKNVLNSHEFLAIKCIREDFKCLKEMTLLGSNQNNISASSENYISRIEFLREMKKLEDRLNCEIAHYKGENDELRQQLSDSENTNRILMDENKSLKNQIDAIKLQLQANTPVAKINSDASYYQGIIKQKDDEIKELRAEVNRLKETISKLENNSGQPRVRFTF